MTPPTIKTHESDEPGGSDEVCCGICRRQISRYTCPSCNLHYCSLKCFRSEKPHAQCSEMFYRKEIEVGIRSESSKTEEDKNKMIELLKRIEDQSVADEDGLFRPSDEDCEEDGLADRFSAIDMSSASADDLLSLLTKEERDKFFVALKDPSSGLARELLESAELEETTIRPWWDAPREGDSSSLSPHIRYGAKPDLMEIPTDLINQCSHSVSLLYNICAVLLPYAYVTRHLAMSPLSLTINDPQDQYEARRILAQCAPFLFESKSTLLHASLSDAVLSFWSRLGPGGVNNKTMHVLLGDVEKLVRPRRIIVTEHSTGKPAGTVVLTVDHPFATTIMAISDIRSLIRNDGDPSIAAPRSSRTVMKLTFYAAHILFAQSSRLHALADEIILLCKAMDKESC